MEDCNTLAADCVVISCCCQCLILQILVFILLELPRKLIRRTRDFARKKLRERKRRGRMMINMVARELMGKKYKNIDFVGNSSIGVDDDDDDHESIRVQARDHYGKCLEVLERHNGNNIPRGCIIEEVDKVMEELSKKGEFGFGSFWCKEEESEDFFPTNCLVNQEFDGGFVRYQLIKMVGSFNYHS